MQRQVAIDQYNKLKEKGVIVLPQYGITIPHQCHMVQGSPSFQLALHCIDEARVLQDDPTTKTVGDLLVKQAKKKAIEKVIEYIKDCETYIKRLQTKEKCCHMCGHQYDDDEWEEEDDNMVITCSEGCYSQIPYVEEHN